MLESTQTVPKPERLSPEEVDELLPQVDGWEISAGGKTLSRTFEMRNFHEIMGLANAIAWVANREDHHPDLELSYKRCTVHFTTHSADGLTLNDFILAARVSALAP